MTESVNAAAPHSGRHAERVSLEALALAFVVRVQGSWTDASVRELKRQLERRQLSPDEATLATHLTVAQQGFFAQPAHLFVCQGRPCSQLFPLPADTRARDAGSDGLSVSSTECQGPCKQAPVATMRVGRRCAMFSQFARADAWQAVLEFARRAAVARSLLVDAGSAAPYVFDPVHDHDKPSVALAKVAFLVGHFEGAEQTQNREPFLKEVIGGWESGGRFISLRMAATYPLSDGRKDIHHAFLVIGLNPATQRLEARAYTDSGTTHDYSLECVGDALVFADRLPGHLKERATGARKVIEPTAAGYRERLEIDPGDGVFVPYYVVEFRRFPSGSTTSMEPTA